MVPELVSCMVCKKEIIKKPLIKTIHTHSKDINSEKFSVKEIFQNLFYIQICAL